MTNDSVLQKRILGRKLYELRIGADVSRKQAAERIARDIQAVGRFERGETLVDAHQLSTLCTLYRVQTSTGRALQELREAAAQPVWWNRFGERPKATAALLAMEELAHRIRQFDHNAIPGLLQTTGYARANIQAIDDPGGSTRVERDVELRMQRQIQLWRSANPPSASYVIDEAVLWRMPGPTPGKRAQLQELLDPPPTVTIQVLPFEAGPHPSMGSYAIFDMELGSLTETVQGVHGEGLMTQQGVIAETEQEIARYELIFERTRAMALTPERSATRIEKVIRSIHDD